MSVNNHRKCAKCGRTRAEDMTVTYHRFPNPGITNITKARAWAKFCWPNKDWTSVEFLHSLHNTSKVLCGRHVKWTQFYDNKRQKLNKFAVPDSTEVEELLNDRENILNQNVKQSSVAGQLMSRVPFSRIDNIQAAPILVEPSTSVVLSTQQTSVEVPTNYESTDNEQNAPIKMLTPASKKRSGILRAINIAKLSEMTSREVKLYNVCRKKLREIIRLRKELKNKKSNMISTIAEDENVQKLCDLNISNYFVVLLQSQLKNCPKKPKGRRYTLQQKIMALVIYKKSPACYRLLRRMLTLPCQSSLNKLLNRVPLKPGINRHIFTSLKKMTQKQTDEENICILSFDEMSIRKHLYYDPRLDEIQGFRDHDNHGRSNEIATKALVFMLAGLRKKWKQPIAFYFSHTLTADRMTVILKEILTECFNSNINVVATVCDLATVNIKALKTVGATTREPFFLHCEREIVAILDPPHLLKCTRNLLMKHDVECTTDLQCNDKTVKGTVKWSHIESFYNFDKNNANFVYAPALTDYHLHPNVKQQMRVKLAAQVFSHTVTAGILAKIASNELPTEAHATAMFVQKFDELFDAVNADSPDLRRGKKYSTNLTARSPHIALFGEMRRFISSMKYLGSKSNPPSQEGWIHTMNAIERLWRNFQNSHLDTAEFNTNEMEMLLADAVEAVELATPESQACGYVCGFIFKKLRHNDCSDCRNTFLSETHETIHMFTSFKEYNSTHNSLNYVNKNGVQCVETMATIINNYLKTNAWKSHLKHNIMAALDCVDFTFLNQCINHLETNRKHIKTSTFFICIKRYTILKNREMDEEEKKKAMERKIRILRNK